MPRYVTERNIAGLGSLSPQVLKAIRQKSCGAPDEPGPRIQCAQSYVTDDGVYCVSNAPSEELIREHASRGGFRADRISKVAAVIEPVTAE